MVKLLNSTPTLPEERRRERLRRGREAILTEADALHRLADSLGDSFIEAVDAVLAVRQRVIVSGMGKSGHVARKIAATFASTGTPALFVHPAEAAHGDLGMIVRGDLLLMLSNSGSTPELRALIERARQLQCAVVGVASIPDSLLMQASDIRLTLPPAAEACAVAAAPTTSTTMMMALGDALAVAVMSARGFTREGFRLLHPGGALGSRFASVDDIMHTGDRMPVVPPDCPMADLLVTMTEKSLGLAGVVDDGGRLIGVVTDGDLRRHSTRLFGLCAGDIMSRSPKTVPAGSLVEDALAAMQANRVTALFVMAPDNPRRPVGVVHVHDITRLQRG